jgi:uncharacterized protein (TIGR02001 family)
MKKTLLAALVAVSPVAAAADGLSTSIGFAVVSEYVSGGMKQSDGIAFQPYVELGINGFYFGIWASNVDGPTIGSATDSAEIDVYLGYRGEAGAISYDIGYYRYFYDNTGDCCGEFIGSIGYSLSDTISMTTVVNFDPETNAAGLQQKFDVALPSDFSVSGDVKVRNQGGRTSWTLGVGKAIGDAAIDVRYHDSDQSNPVYTVGLSWGTSFGG